MKNSARPAAAATPMGRSPSNARTSPTATAVLRVPSSGSQEGGFANKSVQSLNYLWVSCWVWTGACCAGPVRPCAPGSSDAFDRLVRRQAAKARPTASTCRHLIESCQPAGPPTVEARKSSHKTNSASSRRLPTRSAPDGRVLLDQRHLGSRRDGLQRG